MTLRQLRCWLPRFIQIFPSYPSYLGGTRTDDDETVVQNLQRNRFSANHIYRPRTPKMGTALWPRMGNRPLRRLSRSHVDVLLCLAPADRGRGSAYEYCGRIGGSAGFSTGSQLQRCRGIAQRRGRSGRRSAF
jgi:hypothetical protein